MSEFNHDRDNTALQYSDGASNSDAIVLSDYVPNKALIKRPGQTNTQLDFSFAITKTISDYKAYEPHKMHYALNLRCFNEHMEKIQPCYCTED